MYRAVSNVILQYLCFRFSLQESNYDKQERSTTLVIEMRYVSYVFSQPSQKLLPYCVEMSNPFDRQNIDKKINLLGLNQPISLENIFVLCRPFSQS